VTAAGKAAELRRQAEVAREAEVEAAREMIRGLDLDVRILARELYGREGTDLEVARRAVDRMTAVLAQLRGCLQQRLQEEQR
jgi:hypothetical protein